MTSKIQKIVILGSTGSIGVSTLDVLHRHSDRFQVFALTASVNVDLMFAQCLKHRPEFAVMVGEPYAVALQQRCLTAGLRTQVLSGTRALVEVAEHESVDTVMAAIVGAAGLPSCLAAARAGKRLLLANKEALVVGGHIFMQAVAQGGATLLPIDSEHSAIFQALPENQDTWSKCIDKIILTASGGPFRLRDPQTFHAVTQDEACAHPNWVMGRKISVDSATMMNKALEVIEAKFLFGLRPDQIEVVIHPQSVIHSMVQFVDNAIVAQLGTPDMRGPIAYGLSWPERIESGAMPLDFSSMSSLTFETFDTDAHRARYPGLSLAWEVLNAEPGSPAVLNASNEVAVAAFLNGSIRFDQIHNVNRKTLDSVPLGELTDIGDLLDLDKKSRSIADNFVAALAR
jgi:1-deoxy-D-xylulose-5-phosphate reductoisomerase